MDTSPSTETLETTDTGTTLGEGRKVILYNDDSHRASHGYQQGWWDRVHGWPLTS